jgi:DNA-binding protein HU-beta
VTRRELIEWVQKTEGVESLSAAQIGRVLDAAFAGITHALQQEGRYSHPGFGTFTRKDQPERPGRNPKTGEPILIAAATTVRFKPAREFKATLDE